MWNLQINFHYLDHDYYVQYNDYRNQAYAHTSEINRIVTDIRRAAEQSARNNGMRGSSRGSSGGGGGRW